LPGLVRGLAVLILAVIMGGIVLVSSDAPNQSVLGQERVSASAISASEASYKFPATTYCGAISCAAASCHGGGHPGKVGSEYTTWASHDPHSRAYSVLFNNVSQNIVRAMQYLSKSSEVVPAQQNSLCLKCHALNGEVPQHSPVDGVTLQQERVAIQDGFVSGVGCENCHGGAGSWLTTHYQPSFLALSKSGPLLGSREKAEQHGLNPTKDLAFRITMCAKCHIGGEDREVNHDLVAAGHPRLMFEYTSFQAHANYQPHWQEKAYGRDFEARAWAIGQVACARAAIDLLRTRALGAEKQKAPWPELTEYSCYACHKNLGPNSDSWRAATMTDRAAGPIPLGGWATTLLPLLAENEGERRAAATIRELRSMMERNPQKTEGIAKCCTEILKELDSWLARLQQSAERDALEHPLPPKLLNSRFQAIAKDALSDNGSQFKNLDWDGVNQHYLGLESVYRSLNKDQRPPGWAAPLNELRQQLKFPRGYNSPRDTKPSEILKLFKTLNAVTSSTEPPP
jgi:hypothetical protein